MEAVFLKLLNMSLAASWMVAAVVILRFVLKKVPKWIHCLLWAMVAVRLICPFSFESVLSLIPSAEPLPDSLITGPSFDVNTGIQIIDQPINEYLGDRYFEGVTVPANHGSHVMMVLTILWLVGMASLIGYAFVSYLRLRKKVAPSIELAGRIFLCDYIESPFILGIIVPKIYLPTAMDPDTAAHVLAHERSHIKRKDHLWKPLGFALLTIHWFNPLMWLAYILLCRDIELACDEKVIRDMGFEDKKAYSQALLGCSVPRHMIAACPLAFGEVGVKERVKNVLNFKKPTFWIVLVAVIACIAVAVCFLTNPAGMSLAEFQGISADGDTASVILTAGEDSLELTDKADIQKVIQFLRSARFDPDPISQNRIEDRASDYRISLSNGISSTTFCFDVFFSDMWVDDGVKPSLTYSMKKPEQVKEFFETMLGIEIPDVTPTEPDAEANIYHWFGATVERIEEGRILVAPFTDSMQTGSLVVIDISDMQFALTAGSVVVDNNSTAPTVDHSEPTIPNTIGNEQILDFSNTASSLPDQIWVTIPDGISMDVQEGDIVTVIYNGQIEETYPAQIKGTFFINTRFTRLEQHIHRQIIGALGAKYVTHFDGQTVGDQWITGITYDGKYGIAWFNVSDGSYTLDRIATQDELEAVGEEGVWRTPIEADGEPLYAYLILYPDDVVIIQSDDGSSDTRLRSYHLSFAIVRASDSDLIESLEQRDLTDYLEMELEEVVRSVPAHYSHPHGGGASLAIPSGWEYQIRRPETKDDGFAISFRPKGEEGWVSIEYLPDGFGVCGTGLETEGLNLRYHATAGYYDGSNLWSFIRFLAPYDGYVIRNDGAQWLGTRYIDTMEILQSLMLEEMPS